MKIQLLASSLGPSDGRHYATSCLIDDRVAIDAGCIGYLSPLERQRQIEHVFLSHSHADHIASLPLFLDNVYQPAAPRCPTVYASPPVWECLQRHVFNDRIWPDVMRLSRQQIPFLRCEVLEPGKPVRVGDLTITPWPLEHVVPAMGFVIEDGRSAVATVWDTLPTEEIWQRIRDNPRLRAVFAEASFPNSLEWLARKTGHLTPALLGQELGKLGRDVPVIVVHIKPPLHDQIQADLEALGLPRVEAGQPGRIYEF